MARSLSKTLTISRLHLSPKTTSSSSRFIPLRSQSDLPFHHDPTDPADSSAAVDPLLRKLEDAIHRIIVRKSAPDWLPFVPGASYWVPPPRSSSSSSQGLAQLVEKLANPLSEEETLSLTTVRGWPSSSFFIQGLNALTEDVDVSDSSNSEQKIDNVEKRLEGGDQKVESVSKIEEEEG